MGKRKKRSAVINSNKIEHKNIENTMESKEQKENVVGDTEDNNISETSKIESEEIMVKEENSKITSDIEEEIVEENVTDESNILQEKNIENINSDVSMEIIPEKKKINKPIIISFIVLIFIILLFSGIACINKLNDKIYKNVYVLGTDVSGYTADELKEFLNKKNEIVLNHPIHVFQDTEKIYSIIEEDIDLKIDISKTVNNAMNFGRDNNIFIDNINILEALFKNKEIDVIYTYNEEKVNEILKNIDLSVKNGVIDNKYSLDEKNKKLVITRGKSGNSFDYKKLEKKIIDLIEQELLGNIQDRKIYLDIYSKTPNEIDINEIYSKIKRDAQDAYIDKSSTPAKIIPEKVGYDFDTRELQELIDIEENKQEGKIIEFPLKVIEPKVKLNDLESQLYKDKIAGYTTYFDARQHARANNLEVALRYLNGKVIMPGEVFSYNEAIGDTTYAKGYLPAATFKGGTTVNELGGGICQTTSTLYNVVLMANLEIVERHAHGLPVGYVQPSRDATVYSPYLDFKFKNTRSNPIKIVTSYSSFGSLNISIYGLKEKNEYQIDIISQYLSTIPFSTKYIYDNNMLEGQKQLISTGVNGYTSQSFISKKLNGVQVSYEFLSKDTYNPQQQVIKVGTKKSSVQEPTNSEK